MERVSRFAAVVFAALSFAPGAALAASGGGMDPVTSLLYQVGNFLLLAIVLFLVARKPVKAYFVGRRDQIKSDLEEAAALLNTAEARQTEIQAKLADLEAQLDEIRATSKQRAEEEGQRILAKAREAAERIKSDALEAADQELLRAKRELREEAAGLAVELAAEILEEQVGDADRQRLLDEFITRVEPRSDNQSRSV
ncbi:MAG: ATP synthase F0 subunit B [Myxococcota bacterium]|nr:ATP synthase F0 subunit B [Myxococcota bacterium]